MLKCNQIIIKFCNSNIKKKKKKKKSSSVFNQPHTGAAKLSLNKPHTLHGIIVKKNYSSL